MKEKNEAIDKFKEFAQKAENWFGYRLKRIRTDNGGEYTSNEFEEHLKKYGVDHETTIPYTSQQNGVAERVNRSLVETV